jgi:very-short-patch-repair endonuclease
MALRHDFAAKFRRQEPLGAYIVDFVCYEHRLIIEVDGVHHADSDADRTRDAYLTGLGFRVLRVWNGDVFAHLDLVTDWIEAALAADRRVTRATQGGRRAPDSRAPDVETPSVGAGDGAATSP